MVRAITFDAFGTLMDAGGDVMILSACPWCDDQARSLEAEAFLLSWYRHFFAAETAPFLTLAEITEDSLGKTFREYGIDATPTPYVENLVALWREAKAYAEVPQVLDTLDGVPRAVVSNADHEFLLDILQRNGLRFDAVVTSESAQTYKPRPRIFEAALESLRVRPEDVIHVGDSLVADVQGASRLGIRTVWVNRGGLHRGPADPEPDAEAHDLRAGRRGAEAPQADRKGGGADAPRRQRPPPPQGLRADAGGPRDLAADAGARAGTDDRAVGAGRSAHGPRRRGDRCVAPRRPEGSRGCAAGPPPRRRRDAPTRNGEGGRGAEPRGLPPGGRTPLPGGVACLRVAGRRRRDRRRGDRQVRAPRPGPRRGTPAETPSPRVRPRRRARPLEFVRGLPRASESPAAEGGHHASRLRPDRGRRRPPGRPVRLCPRDR